ncbi:Dolichyl-phosphate-mannose--protein mannosyltransferase 2 [Pseudogymnoascus australis]
MASRNAVVASGIEQDGQAARRRAAPGGSAVSGSSQGLEEVDDKKRQPVKVNYSRRFLASL